MNELTTELELLREFTEEELAKLRAIAEVRDYAPGDVVVKQGAPPEAVYVLLEGGVRVTAILDGGDAEAGPEEEVLVRLRPGEFFGELSFITGSPPSLSVVAEQESRIAYIPHPALHGLIAEDGSVCRKLLFAMMRAMVGRLKDTSRELVLSRYFIRGQ